MHRLFLDLNQNLVMLQMKLTGMLTKILDEKFRKAAERMVSIMSQFFFDLTDALEKLKMGKATDVILKFLDEVEKFLVDAYWRFSIPNGNLYEEGTRAIVQVIRTQVIFLDQQRQGFFAFV